MIRKYQNLPVLRGIQSSIRRRLWTSSYQIEPVDPPATRQLLVDVSNIVRHDARTGIQRVVRALLGQLTKLDGPDWVVQPVFASRNHGYCLAQFNDDGSIVNAAPTPDGLQPVVVRKGDIFLGLDLSANILPWAEIDLARWRRAGVAIHILVYDLLPLIRPEWFPPRTRGNFDRWLGVLARQADHCICISTAVASDLSHELANRKKGKPTPISTIPLGSDLASSYPSTGLPGNIGEIRQWIQEHRVILSVGTVEPRKGHAQLLGAMEALWGSQPDTDIALLVVGRPGWKTDGLQYKLRNHAELGRRLMWLEEASDQFLAELYDSAAGLASASQGEGFGLPLIEALHHQLPVLARDLPIFSEIGGTVFDYFDDDRPTALAARIELWIHAPRHPSTNVVENLPLWADSATELTRCISPASQQPNDGSDV